MSEVTFRSDIGVELIDSMASDLAVVRAAQVSVKGVNKPDTDMPRLINYLMESRHGSPFEHAVFTFAVEAPIFVVREWQRHRMSSFNEMSGRYTQLKPEFYRPGLDRKLVNVGTSARPEFTETPPLADAEIVRESVESLSEDSWGHYKFLLEMGIANEVARMVLPLSIYTHMYWTVNARSLMNFISLRVDDPNATFRTRPQIEIQWGAEKVEQVFAEKMPHTYAAFVTNGRVAP